MFLKHLTDCINFHRHMNFTDVSTHRDLCSSSPWSFPENQEQFTHAQKEQIQLQLNRFIS